MSGADASGHVPLLGTEQVPVEGARRGPAHAAVPASLRADGLAGVWALVADRLARHGLAWRGVVQPGVLAPEAELALRSLVERTAVRRLDLGELEAGLRRLGVGTDLPAALAELGHPVPIERVRRRDVQRAGERGRLALRLAAGGWPEPWAGEWADGVVRSGLIAGLDEPEATALAGDVRRVLDAATLARFGQLPLSRNEVAARQLGSAHALDRGTLRHQLVARALVLAVGDGRDLWERGGLAPDLLAAPVLTWALPPVHPVLAAAGEAGVPVHLSTMLLRSIVTSFAGCPPVLVVENPRLVEAAAQRRFPTPVVATSGNPTTAVLVLLRRLVGDGVEVRCHADFDAAGLAICGRLLAIGVQPWRMTSADYLDGLATAESDGVALVVDPAAAPSTPWAPSLRATFDAHRRALHEERLIDVLLA